MRRWANVSIIDEPNGGADYLILYWRPLSVFLFGRFYRFSALKHIPFYHFNHILVATGFTILPLTALARLIHFPFLRF